MTSDELALLAEGNAGEAAEDFRRHLSHCRNCYQAYEDAVEVRAHWLAETESPASPDLILAGRSIGVGRERRGRVTRISPLRLAATTAGVLGLVVAGWLYLASQTKSVLGQHDFAELEPMAATESANGLIILGVAEAEINEQTYRSGGAPSAQSIDPIVARLRAAYDQGEITPDDLFWLITAQLPSGDLPMARFYLKSAPKNDARFLNLEAIVDYRESQLARAEQILREVTKQLPDEAEAQFNFGLVLAENGKLSEGIDWLQRAKQSENSYIAQRAGAAIDSLPLLPNHK